MLGQNVWYSSQKRDPTACQKMLASYRAAKAAAQAQGKSYAKWSLQEYKESIESESYVDMVRLQRMPA